MTFDLFGQITVKFTSFGKHVIKNMVSLITSQGTSIISFPHKNKTDNYGGAMSESHWKPTGNVPKDDDDDIPVHSSCIGSFMLISTDME